MENFLVSRFLNPYGTIDWKASSKTSPCQRARIRMKEDRGVRDPARSFGFAHVLPASARVATVRPTDLVSLSVSRRTTPSSARSLAKSRRRGRQGSWRQRMRRRRGRSTPRSERADPISRPHRAVPRSAVQRRESFPQLAHASPPGQGWARVRNEAVSTLV